MIHIRFLVIKEIEQQQLPNIEDTDGVLNES